jgi:hypothetical protein
MPLISRQIPRPDGFPPLLAIYNTYPFSACWIHVQLYTKDEQPPLSTSIPLADITSGHTTAGDLDIMTVSFRLFKGKVLNRLRSFKWEAEYEFRYLVGTAYHSELAPISCDLELCVAILSRQMAHPGCKQISLVLAISYPLYVSSRSLHLPSSLKLLPMKSQAHNQPGSAERNLLQTSQTNTHRRS